MTLPRTGYENLLDFFHEYDYRRPAVDPARLDFRRPDNVTGHQQRTFNVWWAIEQCWKTGGVGLEIGSGGVHTPWCLSTDAYATDKHPVYGGGCHPHMVIDASKPLPFEAGSFSLVLANHVVEHVPGDVVAVLRDWVRVLAPGGVLGLILPDQQYVDVLAIDKSHCHNWTAPDFLASVVNPLLDAADLLEFDTLGNHFSYNAVMRKR